MTHVCVLLKFIAVSLVIFVISVRHEPPTRRATLFTFGYRFFRSGSAPLVFGDTCVISKMSIAFSTGISNF